MKTFKEYLFEETKTAIGKNAKVLSWQKEWPNTTKCSNNKCDGEAELAIACQEDKTSKKYVSNMHKNNPKGKELWPHDSVAIANYICRKCFSVTSKINQA